MPITEKEKATLVEILRKVGPKELTAITGLLYNTIIEAKLETERLFALGKFILSRVTWSQFPAAMNAARFPLILATEEYLFKNLPQIFEIVPEEPTAPVEASQAPAQPAAETAAVPAPAAPPVAQQTLPLSGTASAPVIASTPTTTPPPTAVSAQPDDNSQIEGESGEPSENGESEATLSPSETEAASPTEDEPAAQPNGHNEDISAVEADVPTPDGNAPASA